MSKRRKRYSKNNETHENGSVIITYRNFEEQFTLMNKLCLKYSKVTHIPEKKYFECNGHMIFGKKSNSKETFNEYASRF